MSRHLLIRCDRAGCPEQTETRASDTEPTSIAVPEHWLTLHESGSADRHYCSHACLLQAFAPAMPPPAQPQPPLTEQPTPSPYATPAAVIPAASADKPLPARRKKA